MKEAILLTDGYKLDHRRQYPEGTEYVYSFKHPLMRRDVPADYYGNINIMTILLWE